jgi:hypothetical protein
VIASRNVTIRATATDDFKVTHVELYENGVLVADHPWSPPYTFQRYLYINGPYTFFTKAYDSSGNSTTSSPVSITVQEWGSPTTTLTAPAPGAVVQGTVTITASASDSEGVWFVDFYDGTTQVCRAFSAPYTCAWDTAAGSNGPHTLRSQAWEMTGLRTWSAAVEITVQN